MHHTYPLLNVQVRTPRLTLVGATDDLLERLVPIIRDGILDPGQIWLNDAVKGFLPGPDPEAQRFYSSDIILLYRQLGFTTVDESLDLVEQAYPGRPIPAKVRFLLTEIVDSMQH